MINIYIVKILLRDSTIESFYQSSQNSFSQPRNIPSFGKQNITSSPSLFFFLCRAARGTGHFHSMETFLCAISRPSSEYADYSPKIKG